MQQSAKKIICLKKINEIIEPLKAGIIVSSIEDIRQGFESHQKPANTKQITELQF